MATPPISPPTWPYRLVGWLGYVFGLVAAQAPIKGIVLHFLTGVLRGVNRRLA